MSRSELFGEIERASGNKLTDLLEQIPLPKSGEDYLMTGLFLDIQCNVRRENEADHEAIYEKMCDIDYYFSTHYAEMDID